MIFLSDLPEGKVYLQAAVGADTSATHLITRAVADGLLQSDI